MTTRILVIGAGFAGMWSALGAVRLLEQQGRSDVEVALVAPEPFLHVRPRLYEEHPEGLKAPLQNLFNTAGIRFIAGRVQTIDVVAQEVSIQAGDASAPTTLLSYDRLVLAAGSQLFCPAIPGLHEHSFNIDQIDTAVRLEEHLRSLAAQPASQQRNTVVVAGAGFTGLELATQLPARLAAIFGADPECRVMLIERDNEVGPELGAAPRPTIIEALTAQGISWKVGAGVAEVNGHGVMLENGEWIAANTVIWTAGARASALTEQIPAQRDEYGRLQVERSLKVTGVEAVFATGDCARAATDDEGHCTMMSCQHAMFLGRSAGYNVVADLLGLDPLAYSQPKYVTCLALGPSNAVYSEGWDRQVKLTGSSAARLKQQINTEWIYPPQGSRSDILAAAAPQQDIPDVITE